MNPLKALTFAFTCIIVNSSLLAQKKDDPEIAGKWHIRNVLYLNNQQGAGIIDYTAKKEGVVLINNQAKAEWETPIDGHVIGIGKYKGNIIAFYTDNWNTRYRYYERVKKIQAVTIDVKAHKILSDQEVYTGKQFIIPEVQNDPSGNLQHLLIRATSENHLERTEALSMIVWGENGNPVTKEISTVAIGGSYAGSCATKGGNVFMGSIVNNSLVVEKFNQEGVLKDKQETTLNIREKPGYRALLSLDTLTNNTVTVGIKYENTDKDATMSFFRFSFDDHKVFTADAAVLNKKSPYKLRNIEDLKPSNIFFTNDKIIFVKEIQYTIYGTGNGAINKLVRESAIVSIYDRQLHLLHETILSKSTMSFLTGPLGLDGTTRNDKLIILSVESSSITDLEDYCYIIDLNTGNQEKKKIGFEKPSASRSMCTQSTFWFSNECVISHLYALVTFGTSYNTVLQKINMSDFEKLPDVGQAKN